MPYPAKTSPDTIRQAALELLEQGGPAGLSMRTLADRLGLRASSLYRHYPDRAALEASLAEEAALALRTAMERASAGKRGAAALEAAGSAYLTFARERPELDSLLHAPRPLAPAGPGAAKDVWNLVLRLVSEVTGREDDTAGAVALWSFLHGFAALERSGLFGLSGPQNGFGRGLSALVRGL